MSFIDPATGQLVRTLADIQMSNYSAPQTTSSPTTQAASGGGLWSTLGNLASQYLTPQNIIGGGLLAGGLASDREPGEVLEARQYLRNLFTTPQYAQGGNDFISSLYSDPTAITRGLTGQVGALQSMYDPLLQQQENQLFNNIQQRMIAGLPSSLSPAMQGNEVAAIRSGFANEALPRRQALLADMAREQFNIQSRAAEYMSRQGGDAAGTILETSRPDPTAEALSRLGMAMLAGNMGGGGQAGAGAGGNPLGSLLSSLFGGGQGTGAGGGTGGLGGLLQQILGGGDVGMAGPGVLGPAGIGSLSALLSSLGSGAGGGFAGYQVGQQMPNQATGALGGAAAGGLTGFAVGGPIGAAIGALVGAVGGFIGQRSQEHEAKAAARQLDVDSQGAQVQTLQSFFADNLEAVGMNPAQFESWAEGQVSNVAAGETAFSFGGISGTLDQQQAVSQVGGSLLLQAYQAIDPRITSLDMVPGLRDSFINYVLRVQYPAGYLPMSQVTNFAGYAGLQHGGMVLPGGGAVVGEAGPEFLNVTRGGQAMVTPMNRPQMPMMGQPNLGQPGVGQPNLGQLNLGQQLSQLLPLQAGMTPRAVPQLLQGLGIQANAYGPGGMVGVQPSPPAHTMPVNPAVPLRPQDQRAALGRMLVPQLASLDRTPGMVPQLVRQLLSQYTGLMPRRFNRQLAAMAA